MATGSGDLGGPLARHVRFDARTQPVVPTDWAGIGEDLRPAIRRNIARRSRLEVLKHREERPVLQL